MRRILLISIIACQVLLARSQDFANKERYLVDSLELNLASKDEVRLVDNCIEAYHGTNVPMDKMDAINEIVEQSWDDNIWPKYNRFLYDELNLILENKNYDPEEYKVYKRALGKTINNMGFYQNSIGNTSKAIDLFNRSLEINIELADSGTYAITLNNIAAIYNNLGDVENALKQYHECLIVNEMTKDSAGMAIAMNNLGQLYQRQDNLEQAFEYYQMSIDIKLKTNDKKGLAASYINLGGFYEDTDQYKEALPYYVKSLECNQQISNHLGIADALNNIGSLYIKQGQLDQAIDTLNSSLKIRREKDYRSGMVVTLNLIGQAYIAKKDWLNAETHVAEALLVARELGYPDLVSKSSQLLYKIKSARGEYEAALSMFELHIEMRDSIKNEETQKATIRQQTQYEFEKEQLLREHEEKEQARVEAEQMQRRNNLQYSLIFLGILLFFGLVLGLGFVKVSPTVAEGLIFFAFLIFFEFILVLGDPYIDSITGGEPIYKLLANALLAGLIFPAHAFFERALKKKLVD